MIEVKTEQEADQRRFEIWRDLFQLKEDILHYKIGFQPEFDAGVLEAAMQVLRTEIDTNEPRCKVEYERHGARRLLTAINGAPATDVAASAKRMMARHRKSLDKLGR